MKQNNTKDFLKFLLAIVILAIFAIGYIIYINTQTTLT